MRTAIFTTQKTALTIETTETVQLLQMSSAAQSVPPAKVDLKPGTHQVTVGAGVFKIVSNNNVRVTGEGPAIHIMYTGDDKDGGWPDAVMSPQAVDATDLHRFFVVPGARSL